MANEVFDRNARVASQEIWTRPEDVTDEQKLIPLVASWKVIKKLPTGALQAVDTLTGALGEYTPAVVIKQDMDINDVIEIREGETRDQDLNVHYKNRS